MDGRLKCEIHTQCNPQNLKQSDSAMLELSPHAEARVLQHDYFVLMRLVLKEDAM